MRARQRSFLFAVSVLLATSSTVHAGGMGGKGAARLGRRSTQGQDLRTPVHPDWTRGSGPASLVASALDSHPRLDEAVRLEAERERTFNARVRFFPSLRRFLSGVVRSPTCAGGIEAIRTAQIERMSEERFQSWSVLQTQVDRVVARLRAPIAQKLPSALHDGMLALITEYLKYAGQPRFSEKIAQIDQADFLPMMNKLLASPEAAAAAPSDKAATKALLQRFYLALVEHRREGGSVEYLNGSVGMDLSCLPFHDALRE